MAVLTLEQAFKLAIEQRGTGRAAQAESLYQRLRANPPAYAEGLLLVAVLARELGHAEDSAEFSRQAIALNPILVHDALQTGVMLAALGRRDEAIFAYRQAAQLLPEDIAVSHRLAVLLQEAGQIDDAIFAYRAVLARHPEHHDALSNLGHALKERGELAESVVVLERAIALRPDSAAAFNNLGNTLEQLNRPHEALVAFRRAVAIEPQLAEAHNNLGNALQRAGSFEEALSEYTRAVEIDPNYPDALVNLGNALKDTGQLPQAISLYRRAVAQRPNSWPASNLLLSLYYDATLTPRQILDEHRAWARPISAAAAASRHPHHKSSGPADPPRRLKIGYVSGDFRHHVVGYNLLPLFEHHDHARFEIFSYSNPAAHDDDLTARFRGLSDHWRDVKNLSDSRLSQLIRADGIDILVDLSLHTGANRLPVFAQKPAPLQLTFAGYPGTTGLAEIDYRLTDPYLDPPGQTDAFYAERSHRLAHTFWCYQPLSQEPAVGPLPALVNGYITFGSLGNFCKVNDAVLTLWSRVLLALPAARLLMISRPGPRRDRTRQFLQSLGIAPTRLDFVDHQPRPDYLKTYHRIDIGLDTFPYNGHTTSLDSFWMGVPVVTLIGESAVGRAGFSQLSNLGLAELAANSPDQFARTAANLAADLPRLAELRRTLRGRMESSALMNAPQFARDIQSAYRSLWDELCARSR